MSCLTNSNREPLGTRKRKRDENENIFKDDLVLANWKLEPDNPKKPKLEPVEDNSCLNAPRPQTALFLCPLCPCLFESRDITKHHIAEVHYIPYEYQSYYGCYGFRAKMVQVPMNLPIMYVPDFDFIEAPCGPQPINVLYCCPVCKDPFVTLYDVQLHLSVKHKDDGLPNKIGFIKVSH